MIGLLIKENEREIAREFFELWKTPWELYRPGRAYEVVISTIENETGIKTKLLLSLGHEKKVMDSGREHIPQTVKRNVILDYQKCELPIYGEALTFGISGYAKPVLLGRDGADVIGVQVPSADRKTIRIGINPFKEATTLLTEGQPAEYAHIPTVDMHISVLRDLIHGTGIPLTEIPPAPKGYDFVCCLSHDVDFIGIRYHFLDRTMLGFLYRALWGSLSDLISRRKTLAKVLQNWKAAFKLPAVYMGLAEDFWCDFDRFLEMEKGIGGTYLFLSRKNCPGEKRNGIASKIRGGKYTLADAQEKIQKLIEHGCEIGLHGIDAWINPESGLKEMDQLREVTNGAPLGVRMHWLYFDGGSPKILDDLGFLYDSTFGYNDAIGFRSGTTQPFRPLGVRNLLEIPMNVQDTALFYPDRMNLRECEALEKITRLITQAEKFGGVLTVNWHTRSLGPERLWGDFYQELLGILKSKNIWFATGRQVAEWFKKRRSVSFADIQREAVCNHPFPEKQEFSHLPELSLKSSGPRGVRTSPVEITNHPSCQGLFN